MEDSGWSRLRRHPLRCPSSLFFTPSFTSQVATIHLRAAQMNLLAVRGRQIKNVAVTASWMDTRRDPTPHTSRVAIWKSPRDRLVTVERGRGNEDRVMHLLLGINDNFIPHLHSLEGKKKTDSLWDSRTSDWVPVGQTTELSYHWAKLPSHFEEIISRE